MKHCQQQINLKISLTVATEMRNIWLYRLKFKSVKMNNGLGGRTTALDFKYISSIKVSF